MTLLSGLGVHRRPPINVPSPFVFLLDYAATFAGNHRSCILDRLCSAARLRSHRFADAYICQCLHAQRIGTCRTLAGTAAAHWHMEPHTAVDRRRTGQLPDRADRTASSTFDHVAAVDCSGYRSILWLADETATAWQASTSAHQGELAASRQPPIAGFGRTGHMQTRCHPFLLGLSGCKHFRRSVSH